MPTPAGAQSPLDAARRLVPLIRSQADRIEADRELPRPVFEALADAGLFHLLVPRSLGGAELDLPTYVRVMETLGAADGSTAWCVNQADVFASYAASIPPAVARTIWVDTPRAVVSNTPVPDAVAVPVEGGFRLTGRLSFSTGCRHAAWVAPQARLQVDGRPVLLPDGQPDARYFFVPAEQAEILDTWHSRGLRGTGTHHFRLDDVFVPAERSFVAPDVPSFEPGPLYLFPRILMFACGDAAIALGLAQACLEAFLELAGAKKAYRATGLVRDQPVFQSELAHAVAELRAGRAFLAEAVGEAWDEAAATGALSLDRRAMVRLATTDGIWRAAEAIDTLYRSAGATAVYADHAIQRYFQDIHVITQHMQARRTMYELVGQHLLGLEADTQRY